MNSYHRRMQREAFIQQPQRLLCQFFILQFIAIDIIERYHCFAPEAIAYDILLLRTGNLLQVIFGFVDVGFEGLPRRYRICTQHGRIHSLRRCRAQLILYHHLFVLPSPVIFQRTIPPSTAPLLLSLFDKLGIIEIPLAFLGSTA